VYIPNRQESSNILYQRCQYNTFLVILGNRRAIRLAVAQHSEETYGSGLPRMVPGQHDHIILVNNML